MNKIKQEIIWNLAVLVLGIILKYLLDIFFFSYHLQVAITPVIGGENILVGVTLIALRYIIITILSIKNKNLQVAVLLLLICILTFIISFYFHLMYSVDEWYFTSPTEGK